MDRSDLPKVVTYGRCQRCRRSADLYQTENDDFVCCDCYQGKPVSPPPQGKSCSGAIFDALKWCAIFFAAWLLIAHFFGDSSTSGSSSRPSEPPGATATRIPTTPLELCEYFARRNSTSDLAVESVKVDSSEGKDYLVVTCKLDVLRDPDDYIRAAVKFMLAVAEPMATRGSFDVMTFVFNGPFVDKYGNDVTLVGARAMCDLSTLRKINFDHFAGYLYIDPYSYFRACDTYFIHPAWQAE